MSVDAPPLPRDVGGATGPLPLPRFEHLASMSDDLGMWEHAELLAPRPAHGFCTDDNARALIVLSRETTRSDDLDALADTSLRFVLDAGTGDGRFHNRRRHDGTWLDEVGSDDAQGRAWWALGVAARNGRSPRIRAEAVAAFDDCARFDSPDHLRPHAFAVLGAVDLLVVAPDHAGARGLLGRSIDRLAQAAAHHDPWFETRLTYDNARLPEALIAGGVALGEADLVDTGLRFLAWLVDVETTRGHFSFVPAAGWAPGEPRPGFDQQPIEAVAMAEACHRAWAVTGDEWWRAQGLRAVRWFVGDNDTGGVLYDDRTGGTRDGLMVDRVNENQGAESTLAGLAALQVAVAFGVDTPATVTR